MPAGYRLFKDFARNRKKIYKAELGLRPLQHGEKRFLETFFEEAS